MDVTMQHIGNYCSGIGHLDLERDSRTSEAALFPALDPKPVEPMPAVTVRGTMPPCMGRICFAPDFDSTSCLLPGQKHPGSDRSHEGALPHS